MFKVSLQPGEIGLSTEIFFRLLWGGETNIV